MRPIDQFVSRACPLMFGAHHRINYPQSGWVEDGKKLPSRLRCKGFRAVLMILGVLVYVDESAGGFQSFHLSKGKMKENPLGQLNLPIIPTVANIFLKKR